MSFLLLVFLSLLAVAWFFGDSSPTEIVEREVGDIKKRFDGKYALALRTWLIRRGVAGTLWISPDWGSNWGEFKP